jgi:hypothetical protein
MKRMVMCFLLVAARAAAEDVPAERLQVCQASPEGKAALSALAEAGVASSDVQDRLQEWQAKGADASRCAQLLTSFAGAAEQAHKVLAAQGVASKPNLVLATTDSLLAGASREHLEKAMGGVTTPESAMARAAALTTLLAQGFAPAASSDAIALASEKGYHDHELMMMATSAGRVAREGGASREVVLGQIGSALREGVSARELLPHLQQALHRNGAPLAPAAQDGFGKGLHP